MALTLGDNFSYQGAKPLDARLKYDTLAAMKAVADATMYDGCMAYCTATEKTYQWKSTNTVDATTGRWREFSSGGSGGTSDYTDLSNKPSINSITLSGNKTSADLGLISAKRLASQTLTAGDTQLTFSDESITTNSTIIPFASVYGIAPISMVVSTGSVVVTFSEQSSDISCYVVVM